MHDDVEAKINEYIDYIFRLNKALDAVAYGAEAVIVTFQPRIAILYGLKAQAVVDNLIQSGKIKYAKQVTERGKYAKRAYITEFYCK